jgi:hypothetical protein
MPLVSRTRHTFRSAELGFFGVEVYTRVQTPRFWGQLCNAGLAVFQRGGFRPLRTSWLKVGTNLPLSLFQTRMGASGPPNTRTSSTACVYG